MSVTNYNADPSSGPVCPYGFPAGGTYCSYPDKCPSHKGGQARTAPAIGLVSSMWFAFVIFWILSPFISLITTYIVVGEVTEGAIDLVDGSLLAPGGNEGTFLYLVRVALVFLIFGSPAYIGLICAWRLRRRLYRSALSGLFWLVLTTVIVAACFYIPVIVLYSFAIVSTLSDGRPPAAPDGAPWSLRWLLFLNITSAGLIALWRASRAPSA